MLEQQVIEEWISKKNMPRVLSLDGFHSVKHAMRFGAEILQIITSNHEALVSLSTSHASDVAYQLLTDVQTVSRETIKKLTGAIHPTETAALALKPTWDLSTVLSRSRIAPAVLLENPRNLGNLGAAIRVAAGMQSSGVVSLGDVDPWHANVIRGSAGLHYALPVAHIQSLSNIEGPILAFDADGQDIRTSTVPSNAALAFGSERHGISEDLRNRADLVLSFPMRPGVSSYNLTTTVAMALYHWTATSK